MLVTIDAGQLIALALLGLLAIAYAALWLSARAQCLFKGHVEQWGKCRRCDKQLAKENA